MMPYIVFAVLLSPLLLLARYLRYDYAVTEVLKLYAILNKDVDTERLRDLMTPRHLRDVETAKTVLWTITALLFWGFVFQLYDDYQDYEPLLFYAILLIALPVIFFKLRFALDFIARLFAISLTYERLKTHLESIQENQWLLNATGSKELESLITVTRMKLRELDH